MAEELRVEHNPSAGRFTATLEGQEAYVAYRRHGTVIDLYSTYVPEIFRGRGIAERLCKAAFAHAKTAGLTAVPSCPYIAGTYLTRHPEDRPLTRGG